jgi:CRISPR-associated endonuclease/helicase Cas3
MTIFYAHSGRKADLSDWQLLRDHLTRVAELGRDRAIGACPSFTNLGEMARVAGLLHDLGKYRPEFQSYLHDPLSVQRELTYHKQAGAAKAADMRSVPVAFAIAGHHGGIPDSADLKNLVERPAGRPVVAAVWPDATADCPHLVTIALNPLSLKDKLTADLITRLLFSCLVDADWTDTGGYEDKVNGRPQPLPPPLLDPGTLLDHVRAFILGRAGTCPVAHIAKVRDDVLRACLDAAEIRPGIFSLTVPTGGGKTLSGLAFALKHAALHGLRRVIYVAPYLSILDQNARVLREALGVERDDPAVFEHHSLAEPPGDEDMNETARAAAARRAENWDAPVILTTSVQFFESLFSNKPGRCRKLHSTARSVVLLDECQTLPPELVAPTCSMLSQLAAHLGCTVVLCTATQPAFDHADMPERLQNVTEIAPPELDLFDRLRRVRVQWPARTDPPLDWLEVAERMRAGRAALCVVNTRRAARELFAALKPGCDAFHLSTSMCPAHRLAMLDEVRRRLAPGVEEPCFLVSTQLIEAGVDVDFPTVLRELAPLEAVIQAAGRCNREGRLIGADGAPGGRVEVFRSAAAVAEPTSYYPPDRWYKAGRSVLETSFLNAGREPRIDSPEDISEYFERLYRAGELDGKKIQKARERLAFAEVAAAYRLIQDDGEAVFVATWKQKEAEVAALLAAVQRHPTRANFDRAVRSKSCTACFFFDRAVRSKSCTACYSTTARQRRRPRAWKFSIFFRSDERPALLSVPPSSGRARSRGTAFSQSVGPFPSHCTSPTALLFSSSCCKPVTRYSPSLLVRPNNSKYFTVAAFLSTTISTKPLAGPSCAFPAVCRLLTAAMS